MSLTAIKPLSFFFSSRRSSNLCGVEGLENGAWWLFCTLAVVSVHEHCRVANRVGKKWENFWPGRFPGSELSAESSRTVVCGEFNET